MNVILLEIVFNKDQGIVSMRVAPAYVKGYKYQCDPSREYYVTPEQVALLGIKIVEDWTGEKAETSY